MRFVTIRDIHGNEKRVPVYDHPEDRQGHGTGAESGKGGGRRKADPGRDGPAEGGRLRDLLNHSDRF